MTGLSAQVVSHLVRRGVNEMSMSNGHGRPQSAVFEFSGFAVAGCIFLAIATFLVLISIEYTVGNLIAKLAMIESSTTTTIIESRPPAYTEEPDAPLEKKPLIEEADIEIVTIKHKPITTSVKATIKHLRQVGGFSARWRGLRESILYHALVNIVGHTLSKYLFSSNGHLAAQALGFSLASLLFCRFKMVWTHAMVAAPVNKPWYRRYCVRKGAFVLALPTLIYLVCLHANVVVPIAAWFMLDVFDYADIHYVQTLGPAGKAIMITKVLSGPVIALLVMFFLTIPANTALSRIEACLLQSDEQTVVPFDKEGLMADLDLTVRGAPGKLFAAAWKSVSFSTRFRVMGVYAKMVLFQITAILVNSMIALGIVYITGGFDQLRMMAYVMLA